MINDEIIKQIKQIIINWNKFHSRYKIRIIKKKEGTNEAKCLSYYLVQRRPIFCNYFRKKKLSLASQEPVSNLMGKERP
jgi:hypothetical protein